MRADRSWLPSAISALAVAILSVLWRTWSTMRDSASLMAYSERSRSPNSSPRVTASRALRSPLAMQSAKWRAWANGR